MQEFKNRLLEFVYDRYNTSIRKFEEMCGLTNGTIASIKVKGPSADIVSKISDKCPELNLNWLFTGEGEMYKTEAESKTKEEHSLPLIPLDSVAGYGTPAYDDARVEDYYSIGEFRDNADFLIRVKGDSMAPKYMSGDVVACKKILETLFFQWGRVYVLYTQSQGVMIKRIQPSENNDCIKCVSDNEKYAPFDVPKSDIVALALVNGSISLE